MEERRKKEKQFQLKNKLANIIPKKEVRKAPSTVSDGKMRKRNSTQLKLK